jgi:hypothetical protein
MIRQQQLVLLFTLALCMFPAGQSMAGERLNGEEVRKLLVGNTVTGTYADQGSQIRFYEYSAPDGTLVFSDEHYGKSSGTWEIRDDGCNYTNYADSDDYDGCYYYEDHGDGTLTVHRPQSDEPGTQTILEGDPQNLSGPDQTR